MSHGAQGATPRPSLLADLDRYWFGYGSPVTLGVFRILLSFGQVVNILFLLTGFDAWFSERGFVPSSVGNVALQPIDPAIDLFGLHFVLPFSVPRLSLLDLDFGPAGHFQITDSRVTLLILLVALVSALLTMLGLWTRFSSIIAAICLITIQNRNILILHGGDTIFRLGMMYLAIAPCGAACSLDRLIGLWRGTAPKTPALVPMWSQRLIQFNLALAYFTTWWAKMDGGHWRDGTATWYTTHLQEFKRFWVPDFVYHPMLSPVLTYGTLIVELALATIVFYRPARGIVLVLGLMMHGFIEYSMNIPLFAYAICSFYICFYEGDEVSAWAKWMGAKMQRWRIQVKGASLREGPGRCLKAMDPFDLVDYVPDSDQPNMGEAQILDATGKKKGWLVLALRSVGSWPWGFVPGIWRKLVRSASVQ